MVVCWPSFAQQPDSNILQEALKYEGRTVVSLAFEPDDQPLTKDDLAKRVPLHVGSSFHEADLRTALQNLYASGRYADLAVDASEEGGGVALRFVTQRAYFVGKVAVSGIKDPPNEGQLLSASKLRTGSLYSAADTAQATASLQNLLRQNGFYNADVQAQVDYEPEWEEAHVSFNIDPGHRAKLEKPDVNGNKQISTARIIRSTHWKRLYGFLGLGWRPVTNERVRSGLDGIRRDYEKRSLLQSLVTLNRLEYHDDSNTVQAFIDIKEGPRVAIRVEGANIGQGKLIELVPMFQEHSIDPDLITEGDHNIEQYLEARGYFEAEVSHSTTDGKDASERIVTYIVDRGSRHKLVYLGITGNHYFPSQMIRERMLVEPAHLPRFPYGRFNSSYLRQDLQAIRNLYASNGFRDVNVTSRVEDDFHGGTNHLGVFIEIVEGRQWLVDGVKLEGVADADREKIEDLLSSAKSQVYSDASISLDRENVLNYYYGLGYLGATFDYYPTPAAEPYQINLRYVVNPGGRTFVRNVLITGLETTDPSLIFKRLELKGGEPLSLAKEIDTQRRLYNLGIFSHVTTAIQNATGDEESKYVLYDVDEARHYSFTFGFGAQIARIGGGVTSLDNPAGSTGFAPRVAVGVARNNLFGLGQTLGLQTAASTIEQRASLTYFIPHFISNDKLSLTTSALLEDSNDIRTFTEHRREGSIQLSERLSRSFTFQYRVAYRHITLSNLKIGEGVLPVLAQPETAGVANFTIIHDRRDDPTDAHHGSYTTLDLSYAPGFLGTQTHFARGLFRNSTYHLFGRDFVFARSTQFGVIQRTGGKNDATTTDLNPIPLAERLYSGGSTSLRAFPDFQAGPRDGITGFPVGGNALLANTFELRFPLFGDNLGGVLFHDAGNVYSSIDDVSVRFRQHANNLQDFNYMVQSVGFGFRYRSPIGPISLDFSFSPDAPRFYGFKGTEQQLLQCSIDKNCPAGVGQKINAFQFHFSLGQAF
jgi:outer membrane protein assembly complex protein YaeT